MSRRARRTWYFDVATGLGAARSRRPTGSRQHCSSIPPPVQALQRGLGLVPQPRIVAPANFSRMRCATGVLLLVAGCGTQDDPEIRAVASRLWTRSISMSTVPGNAGNNSSPGPSWSAIIVTNGSQTPRRAITNGAGSQTPISAAASSSRTSAAGWAFEQDRGQRWLSWPPSPFPRSRSRGPHPRYPVLLAADCCTLTCCKREWERRSRGCADCR
jgi:hypothetical protein